MKKRSPKYPMRTLLEARNLAVNVFEKVGDATPLKPADLATHGGVAKHDADTIASTADQFGFMNLLYGKGYAPVAAVCNILRLPQGKEEAEQYLVAFTKPEIYKTIITEYKGKVIPQTGLEIYLIRFQNFSDAGAKQCAKYFLENAKFLGLINSENVFNIDTDIVITPPIDKTKKIKNGSEDKAIKTKNEVKITPPIQVNPPGTKNITVWVRSKKLIVPVLEDMTAEDWEAFIGQLQEKKN